MTQHKNNKFIAFMTLILLALVSVLLLLKYKSVINQINSFVINNNNQGIQNQQYIRLLNNNVRLNKKQIKSQLKSKSNSIDHQINIDKAKQLEIQNLKQQKSQYFHFAQKIEDFKLLSRPKLNNIPPYNAQTDRYQLNYDMKTLQKRFFIGKTKHLSFNHNLCHENFSKFILGLRLAEVTNNINYYGEFIMENYNYYDSAQEKFDKLTKTLKKEKEYYEEKHQISKYINNQIRFCVVVASRNNAITRIYMRNLNSIFQQEYDNYHIVYFDDGSTDNLSYYVKEYIKQNKIPQEKLRLITNKVRKGGLDSFYKAGHEYCQSGEIMAFIDGDDVLIGRQVFSLVNAVYQKHKVALTYGSNLQFDGYNFEPFQGYISPNPQFLTNPNLNFRQKGLQLIHMKTMYVDVFRKIDKQVMSFKNGSFLMQITDIAFFQPATQLAGTRIKFIEEIIYERSLFIDPKGDYGNEVPLPQTLQRIDQIMNLTDKRYTPIQPMQFAENPKTTHYTFKQKLKMK